MSGKDKLEVDDKPKDAESELHLDDEKDTLYNDGLEVEDDSEKLVDTRDQRNRS